MLAHGSSRCKCGIQTSVLRLSFSQNSEQIKTIEWNRNHFVFCRYQRNKFMSVKFLYFALKKSPPPPYSSYYYPNSSSIQLEQIDDETQKNENAYECESIAFQTEEGVIVIWNRRVFAFSYIKKLIWWLSFYTLVLFAFLLTDESLWDVKFSFASRKRWPSWAKRLKVRFYMYSSIAIKITVLWCMKFSRTFDEMKNEKHNRNRAEMNIQRFSIWIQFDYYSLQCFKELTTDFGPLFSYSELSVVMKPFSCQFINKSEKRAK